MCDRRPKFYVGLHQPANMPGFRRCFVSITRLLGRKADVRPGGEWMLDSGAFTRIKDGLGHLPVDDYAARINRWSRCGGLVAAVTQDYMCEPFILAITKLTVAEHQAMTLARYDLLLAESPAAYILPVLQGYRPEDYVAHVRAYGDRLRPGQWVGVGSVCKKNARVSEVEAVRVAIKGERPDLRLHGFGLKKTAVQSVAVRGLLHSADSMAWSYAARREGRNANDPAEAARYAVSVAKLPAAASTARQDNLPGMG